MLLSILNKTLTTLPLSKLSGAFSVYENAARRVTLVEFVKDNLLLVTTVFAVLSLLIILVILRLLMKGKEGTGTGGDCQCGKDRICNGQ